MNIIIAGNGKVGKILTRDLLAEGHEITIIDRNPDVLENSIEQYDVLSLVGNCASMEVLKDADIRNVDLLIAATNSDEINLLTCITARHLNPKVHTIARLRNVEYEETVSEMKQDLNLSLSINPDKQAASEIWHLLRYPGFLKRDRFVNGAIQIVELSVDEGSKLCHLPLNQLGNIVKCQTLVCAVLRKGRAMIPSGDFVLESGDHIFVTASGDNIMILLRNLGLITKKIKDVMILGGSRIAYYLTQKLIDDGMNVKIMDINRETCERFADRFPKATIVCGDASQYELLLKEGVEEFDAIVSLTGTDELNIMIGVYGSSIYTSKVITKLGRADNLNVVSKLPIGSVITPKQLCSNAITRYVRAMNNQVGAAVTIHTIADDQVEAIEFIVDETTKYCGTPLSQIRFKKNVLLTSITKGRDIVFPKGDSTFDVGDHMVVVTNGREVIHLNDIFEE